jgi:hypothetical protein
MTFQVSHSCVDGVKVYNKKSLSGSQLGITPAGILSPADCAIALLHLGPLHTKPTVLPTKLNIVKTSNGILCIALIIHVDK